MPALLLSRQLGRQERACRAVWRQPACLCSRHAGCTACLAQGAGRPPPPCVGAPHRAARELPHGLQPLQAPPRQGPHRTTSPAPGLHRCTRLLAQPALLRCLLPLHAAALARQAVQTRLPPAGQLRRPLGLQSWRADAAPAPAAVAHLLSLSWPLVGRWANGRFVVGDWISVSGWLAVSVSRGRARRTPAWGGSAC